MCLAQYTSIITSHDLCAMLINDALMFCGARQHMHLYWIQQVGLRLLWFVPLGLLRPAAGTKAALRAVVETLHLAVIRRKDHQGEHTFTNEHLSSHSIISQLPRNYAYGELNFSCFRYKVHHANERRLFSVMHDVWWAADPELFTGTEPAETWSAGPLLWMKPGNNKWQVTATQCSCNELLYVKIRAKLPETSSSHQRSQVMFEYVSKYCWWLMHHIRFDINNAKHHRVKTNSVFSQS